MKSFTTYKILFVAFLLSLSASVSAQCPFTASITTNNAGGCGSINGKVFFTVQPTTPGSIVGTYYLVRRAGDNSLVTSTNNTNPEVTLPAGNYIAEVKVQCASGTQASWTNNFTINTVATSTNFTAAYSTMSRLTTLNAYPSGMLQYNFTGTGPYTINIIEYPADYVGALHFANIPNGIYKIEKLAAGNYKFRITNGCQVTTDGPRTIIKTPYDMPTGNSQPYHTVRTYNMQGGGVPTTKPTTDYKSIYFGTNGNVAPVDYWGTSVTSQFYEYGWYYDGEGQTPANITTWYPLASSCLYLQDCNRIDTKYTIKQMMGDVNKLPTVVVRLKGTSITKSVKLTITNPTNTGMSNPFKIYPSTINCNNVDVEVNLYNRAGLTYPLDVQLLSYDKSTVLKTHTVTAADMQNSSMYVKISNVNISTGLFTRFLCKGDATVQATYDGNSTYDALNTTGVANLIKDIDHRRSYDSPGCSNEYSTMYLQSTVDLSGAKVKYTGSIPLPAINQEFTIPAITNEKVCLTTPAGTSNIVGYNDYEDKTQYTIMPAGTYSWEISIPCGGGFTKITKSITITTPQTTMRIAKPGLFNPVTVSTSQCSFVEIELGNNNEIKEVFQYFNPYSNSYYNSSYYTLCQEVNTGSWGKKYLALSNSHGVYYDGGSSNYLSADDPLLATIPRPKIRISRPGTYYLIGSSSNGNRFLDGGSCYLMKKFVVEPGDLVATLDIDKTGSFFCSQDKSSGIVFVHRKGTKTGNQFVFKIWNASLSYNKSVTTDEVQVKFDDIDVSLYGTQFNVSVEPLVSCSSSPSVATVTLNELGNSVAFVKQVQSSNCYGTSDVDLEGVAYTAASYKWKDVTGALLSTTNKLTGKFATGTKLYLEVTFHVTGPGGVETPCGLWTKEYVVTGTPLAEYFWKNNAVSSDWNNKTNWNDKNGAAVSTVPGECSCAYIPATSNYYPDLASSSPLPKVTDIYFEYGAQIYSQHKLTYRHAFVSYNTGYYATLTDPAPNTLVQPTSFNNQVTASANNKFPIATVNLPKMERGRWYMLAAPLKDMYSADFQLAAKPYTIQRFYKNIAKDPTLFIADGFAVTPQSDQKIADNHNSVAIWIPPHSEFTGSKDQSTLQALQGSVLFPYFYPYKLNDEITNLRPDMAFDRTTNKMKVMQFELETLALSNPKEITRSAKASRFVYEDASDAIPAGDVYDLTVSADSERINGEIMVGNPFMAPIDFDKLFAANVGVISRSYKIVVNGVDRSYEQLNPGAAGSLGKFIAPMQSFIIKLTNPTAAATIKFPISISTFQDTNTVKVKVQ